MLSGIFGAERHFPSKISSLNFDLISTSILLKVKRIRKRSSKMAAIDKCNVLEKLLLIAVLRRSLQRWQQKYRKSLGSANFSKNGLKKTVFENLLCYGQTSQHCWFNILNVICGKTVFLRGHISQNCRFNILNVTCGTVICGTDNVFTW